MVKGTPVVSLGDETNRKPCGIGGTSPDCRTTFARGQGSSRSGKDCARIQLFGKALEGCIGSIWVGRARSQTPSWPLAATDAGTEATTGGASGRWAVGGRLSNETVDVPACSARDSGPLWRNVSCRSRAAHFARAWLDVSEAGAARERTSRARYSRVAQAGMAADKKRGVVGKLALFFSTKVASCCNPFAVGPGPLPARRRSNTPGIGVVDCRPWRPCPCLPAAYTSAFITTCNAGTSMRQTRQNSCAASIMVFNGQSFSLSTATASTVRQSVSCGKLEHPGSESSGFHPMHPISIQSKPFGITQNASIWLTSSPTIWTILRRQSWIP